MSVPCVNWFSSANETPNAATLKNKATLEAIAFPEKYVARAPMNKSMSNRVTSIFMRLSYKE